MYLSSIWISLSPKNQVAVGRGSPPYWISQLKTGSRMKTQNSDGYWLISAVERKTAGKKMGDGGLYFLTHTPLRSSWFWYFFSARQTINQTFWRIFERDAGCDLTANLLLERNNCFDLRRKPHIWEKYLLWPRRASLILNRNTCFDLRANLLLDRNICCDLRANLTLDRNTCCDLYS